MATAKIDERDILPKIVGDQRDMLVRDKGFIRSSLQEKIVPQNLNLQTPLCKNMDDPRPKKLVPTMRNIRRIV